jgi:cytochrome c oxidase subunit I
MSETTNPTDVTETEEPVEHIHMPSPSWSPIVLALGMAGVAFGVVLGGVVLIIGALLLLAGLGTWVIDEIRHASAADAELGHESSEEAEAHAGAHSA